LYTPLPKSIRNNVLGEEEYPGDTIGWSTGKHILFDKRKLGANNMNKIEGIDSIGKII
jgi:hypothetical protein